MSVWLSELGSAWSVHFFMSPLNITHAHVRAERERDRERERERERERDAHTHTHARTHARTHAHIPIIELGLFRGPRSVRL